MTFLDLFNQMAFPLAACIAMGWYVYHTSETYRKDRNETEVRHQTEISELNLAHKEAEERIVEAINNNTLVMTKICERIGDKE